MTDDRRLIGDYRLVEAISQEASREKVSPQRAYLDVAPVVGAAAPGNRAGGHVRIAGA
jgi:hypothetical protein